MSEFHFPHGHSRKAEARVATAPVVAKPVDVSDAERHRLREQELETWLQFSPAPDAIARDAAVVEELRAQGIELEESELLLLERYLGLLFATNARFNLTSITKEDAWQRHVLDSLSLMPPLASLEVSTAMDIGSGGGLPGIPLAICRNDIQWTLLEATAKKARFLIAVVEHLGLKNVKVLHARAETTTKNGIGEELDVIVARAVGAFGPLAQLAVPYLRIGGVLLAIKGEKASEETEAAKARLHALHAQVINQIRTRTNTIVVMEKMRKTPAKYFQ
ncbi:MAG: 16S rRNA (guanine(527)-N(7))-methyltransferase RsmG [Phycisphaerales bacterium]|nr:16S rRNA (guanine(527)-N(7))-methyltransferase RsmG [Phycisphaerales bacterium]